MIHNFFRPNRNYSYYFVCKKSYLKKLTWRDISVPSKSTGTSQKDTDYWQKDTDNSIRTQAPLL